MILIDDVLISSDVVEKNFVCNLEKCKGACCWEGDFGAPLEKEEIRTIKEIMPIMESYLSDRSISKINKDGWSNEFKTPEEKFTGTQLHSDGSCVFLAKKGDTAYCAFEQANNDGKTDFKKPISCHLYPVRVSKNETTGFEALNYDKWDICSAACRLGDKLNIPIYSFVKDAIIRKYGQLFYDRLDQIAQNEKDIN